MKLFVKLNLRDLWSIWLALMLMLFISCHSEYTFQLFTFPPGSKPHEDNWEYTARIIVSSNHSPITDKSKKNVQIKVYDQSNTIFLKDEYEFISASIDASVAWDKFEEIKIELLEVGNEFAEDDYNRQLVKSGPHKLINLTYKYNQEDRRFRKNK